MVKWEEFFLDGAHLVKLTGAHIEVVVVEMFVGIVARVVGANFGVLLEMVVLVVVLVQLMVWR